MKGPGFPASKPYISRLWDQPFSPFIILEMEREMDRASFLFPILYPHLRPEAPRDEAMKGKEERNEDRIG